MIKDFGVRRVLEPKGAVPATAWKLDNSIEISDEEVLMRIERLNVEWDSFQQICSSSGFNENRIRAKILDIVDKRGKLHNPFTGTGGCFLGTVEKTGKKYDGPLKEGERAYCLVSLCGVPISLDRVGDIDFNYGQVDASGHAVLFRTSPVFPVDETLGVSYTLSAMNEAGCLMTAKEMAENNAAVNIAVIGRNACTSVVYASAVKKASPSAHVTAIMDENLRGKLEDSAIEEIVAPDVDHVIMTNLSDPIGTYEKLKDAGERCCDADMVIVAEDVYGVETLAVFMAKASGCIYFTTVDNHYAVAQTVAESIGKSVYMYLFDQYIRDYPLFTMDVVRSSRDVLDRLDSIYKEKAAPLAVTDSRARSQDISGAGREGDFIYKSSVTARMVEEAINIARYDCNVIIQGETGTGKERVLSIIHQNSERNAMPCVKINCATVQESLAESEFFGYEPGSFTGASTTGKKGYFEMADNGILFLDEIGTLSLSMQSKLLRVLQENTFYRVGGTRPVSVNVRVVVANNVPLRDLVDKGDFREDLFYRLNICCIDVPPLRNRKEDISCLAEGFAASWSGKYNVSRKLSSGALDVLYRYDWPGNVRELENVVHRLVISAEGGMISAGQAARVLSETQGSDQFSLAVDLEDKNRVDFHEIMDMQERQLIEYAMKKGGTTRKAADILGLPQATFARKKLKYGL